MLTKCLFFCIVRCISVSVLEEKMYKKIKILFCTVCFLCASSLFAFQSGALLHLRADFGGSITQPSIPINDLKDMNPLAESMIGVMSNLLLGGEVQVGYVFGKERFFKNINNKIFSGIGVFGHLGFGQGTTAQKITAQLNGTSFDIFMFVNFLPIINFSVSGKAYFFNNKLAVGLGVGSRVITDMNPTFLVYSSDGSVKTEVGQIIVTEAMMKKMNPFMFSTTFLMDYNIPIVSTVDIVLGWQMRYNVYRPKYLTMPPSLAKAAEDANHGLDLKRPFPKYWLNSFDFGVNLGVALKL